MSISLPITFISSDEIIELEFFENFPLPTIYYDIKIHGDNIYFDIVKNGKKQVIIKQKNNLKDYYIKNQFCAISSSGKIGIMEILIPTFRRLTQSEFDQHSIQKNGNLKIFKELTKL